MPRRVLPRWPGRSWSWRAAPAATSSRRWPSPRYCAIAACRWCGSARPVRWKPALVPQHGIEIDTLPVAGVRGKGKLTLLAAPFKLLRAVSAARTVLRRRHPRAVIGFGGFASGPGGLGRMAVEPAAAGTRAESRTGHDQPRAVEAGPAHAQRFPRQFREGRGRRKSGARGDRCAAGAGTAPWPDAKVRCACWCLAAARVHVRSTRPCRRRLPRLMASPWTCATSAERSCAPRPSTPMPPPACRRAWRPSSTTWPPPTPEG